MSLAFHQNTKRGRPPKTNVVHDHTGKSRGETVESIIGTALLPKLREGIKFEDAVVRDERGKVVSFNQNAGHILGRLKIWCDTGISQQQFWVGMQYAELVGDYQQIIGLPSRSARSPGFQLVSRGETASAGPSKEKIDFVRGRYRECFDELIAADYGTRSGNVKERISPSIGAELTYNACLDLCDISSIKSMEIGIIRVGLNALGRVFR